MALRIFLASHAFRACNELDNRDTWIILGEPSRTSRPGPPHRQQFYSPMPIEFTCNNCNKMLRVPEGTEGKDCQCPSCGSVSTIPKVNGSIGADSSTSTAGSASEKPSDDGLIRVTCPKCQYPLRCKPELKGTKGQCKQCKHIFVIGETSVAASEVTALVFSCPKCDQLFDGKPEMEGRKGKCHSCGEVFPIKLRQADSESTAKIEKSVKPASAPPATQLKPSQSKPSQSKPSQPNAPTTASASSPTPTSSLQVICGSCQGAMEVPATAVGKTVACPHCQQLLQIPGREVSPSSPKPSIFDQPASSLFDSPSSQPKSGIFDGLDVPTTGSNYPSYPPVDLYGAPPSYQPTSYPPAPYQPTSYAPPPSPAYAPTSYNSPYQTPSTALQQASSAEYGGNREWLVSIASWQGRLSWSLLIYISSFVLMIAAAFILVGVIGPSERPPIWLLIVLAVARLIPAIAGFVSLVSYIVLCVKMFESSKAVLYIVGFFIGICVPFLPFILMIVAINHATGILRSYGIRAGFMGVDPSSI